MKKEPKNWKYKRTFKFKNKVNNLEPSMGHLSFSYYGLVVQKDTFLHYNQLLTVYRILKKNLKKDCYIRFNFSCILPFTKKPVSMRMGKGKGAWKGFNVFLRKGTFLLEVGYKKNDMILKFVLQECLIRLPANVKIIKLKI